MKVMAARYIQDGYFWDYSSLSLQRDYDEKKFVQTARNVYDALMKARGKTSFTLGSCPEIVVLGCGPAPEMVAVKVDFAIWFPTCNKCNLYSQYSKHKTVNKVALSGSALHFWLTYSSRHM